MRKILEKAQFYTGHYLPDSQLSGRATYFLELFQTIEDEIEEVKNQIDDLTTKVYVPFRSIATDKDGKPEGGLQKGDLVKHKEFGYGILDEPKGSIGFSGWFEGIDRDKPIMVSRKNLIFILRPSKDC